MQAEPSLHDGNVEVSDATKYRSEDLIEIGENAIHLEENPPACLVS